ncbi:MAG TPA: hypothetical protein VI776_06790 [Anaerolineales bacterium]|nr:hypothetical protein [Anaerolineales bacterium]
MHRKSYQVAWLISLLIGLSLACQLVTGLQEDLGQARGTAGAISTQAQGLITQVQGAATAVEESGLLGTARALATQEGPALLETAQALATEADERGLKETAQAVLTDQGPALQALTTYAPGDVLGTLQALATQVLGGGQAPEDIPIVADPDLTSLTATSDTVSYTTTLSFQTVLDFYRQEMLLAGWQAVQAGSFVMGNAAFLQYEKIDRAATVTILTASPQITTSVLINIRSK